MTKEPRNCTVEERRRKFLALKETLTAESKAEESRWHEIDNPLTPEQYNQIPAGQPGISGRTQNLWVKYRHNRRREIVAAQGYFDHEDGRWSARYEPEENGDVVLRVEAIAWAYMEPGVKPWEGSVILTRPNKVR